jgi:hypothetical protein
MPCALPEAISATRTGAPCSRSLEIERMPHRESIPPHAPIPDGFPCATGHEADARPLDPDGATTFGKEARYPTAPS